MHKGPTTQHITLATGNVFSDLGFDEEDAAALAVASQQAISEKLAIRESLNTEADGQAKSVVETPTLKNHQ